jgi:acyl CoA:acetate/3-ketoacid CoA transferase
MYSTQSKLNWELQVSLELIRVSTESIAKESRQKLSRRETFNSSKSTSVNLGCAIAEWIAELVIEFKVVDDLQSKFVNLEYTNAYLAWQRLN